MQVRILLYDDIDISYSQKETSFYGKYEEFYNKLVEYAELLQCRDNEEKEGIK